MIVPHLGIADGITGSPPEPPSAANDQVLLSQSFSVRGVKASISFRAEPASMIRRNSKRRVASEDALPITTLTRTAINSIERYRPGSSMPEDRRKLLDSPY